MNVNSIYFYHLVGLLQVRF